MRTLRISCQLCLCPKVNLNFDVYISGIEVITCDCAVLANIYKCAVIDFLEKEASSPCLDKERFHLDSIHIDKGLRDEVFLLCRLKCVPFLQVF